MSSKTLFALFAAGSLCVSGVALGQADAQPKKDAPKTTAPAPKEQPKDKDATKKEHAKDEASAKIGEKAPAFTLTDTEGKTVKLSDFAGKIVVLEWFNPDCPVVQRVYKEGTMTKLAGDYKSKNVVWLAINSSAPGKEGAGKERNTKARTDWKITYPLLLDESGTVGHAYGSKNTPTMYIIAADGTLAYRGAIDNGNPGTKGDVNYVQKALDEILAGQTVTKAETKAYGCGVKYADDHKDGDHKDKDKK